MFCAQAGIAAAAEPLRKQTWLPGPRPLSAPPAQPAHLINQNLAKPTEEDSPANLISPPTRGRLPLAGPRPLAARWKIPCAPRTPQPARRPAPSRAPSQHRATIASLVRPTSVQDRILQRSRRCLHHVRGGGGNSAPSPAVCACKINHPSSLHLEHPSYLSLLESPPKSLTRTLQVVVLGPS